MYNIYNILAYIMMRLLPRHGSGLTLQLRSQASSPLRPFFNKDFNELTKAKLSFNNALMAYSGFLVGKF